VTPSTLACFTPFDIGVGTMPQPVRGGGSVGGNAQIIGNLSASSLVDAQPRALGGVNRDSDVTVPDPGNRSGHQTPGSVMQSSATPGNGVPLASEISEISSHLKDSFAALCHCDDKFGVEAEKRVTGPLLRKSLPH
jgi:hypothetical protein